MFDAGERIIESIRFKQLMLDLLELFGEVVEAAPGLRSYSLKRTDTGSVRDIEPSIE